MNWRGRCANRKFVRSTKAIKVKGEYEKDEKGFRVRKKGRREEKKRIERKLQEKKDQGKFNIKHAS